MKGVRRVLAGLARALSARRGTFAAVAATVFMLDILVPPLVLSLARARVDYFTFNPWLPSLPAYLRAGREPLPERVERAWGLALFWFSADGVFGIDWGFAVTAADLARFALMGLLIGAYFALWRYRRESSGVTARGLRAARHGGLLGAAASVLGLATGGCTVMGCGAPMIPVVGLAFVGLSSGTLAWLAHTSTIATATVIAGMALGVAVLAWQAGASDP